MNIVTTVIKSRHSVRKFKPDTIEDLAIRDAIECAARAPTAKNIQPWMFGIIRNKDMLSKIADLTDNGKFISSSPLCFAIFGEKKKNIISKIVAQPRKILLLPSRRMELHHAGWPGKRSHMQKESEIFLVFPKITR